MSQSRGTVVVVSSHVARGSVGNRAMTFALERLGFTAWVVPTVVMAHHPGHGPTPRIVPEAEPFAALLRKLVEGERAAEVAAVLSGYLASESQAQAVAELVATVRQARPEALYLCDPVIGDAGHLYVGEPLANAMRDRLVPLADIATPNRFECAWLAGAGNGDWEAADIGALARSLGRPAILATSAPALRRGGIGNLLVEQTGATLVEHPVVATGVKGTGDLLAAVLLARRLEGHSLQRALELAASTTFEILAATERAGGDELMLAEFRAAIAHPQAPVHVSRIAMRT